MEQCVLMSNQLAKSRSRRFKAMIQKNEDVFVEIGDGLIFLLLINAVIFAVQYMSFFR